VKQQLEQAYKEIEGDLLKDLRQLISFESVSAYGSQLDECASFLKELLRGFGFSVEVVKNKANKPVVLAERIPRGNGGATLLLYNHYDVQPPEPLEEWSSNPFELVERGDRLFGRGVADDKGDIISRLYAVEILDKITSGEAGLGIKWIIEGEEEVGSPSLDAFVAEHLDKIRADACLWEAGDLTEQGIPNFYLGVKGMLYVEISRRTADYDKHSMYAPIIPNAAWELIQLLSRLRDKRGRVRIPGFYKRVKPPTREELKSIREIRIDYKRLMQQLGIREVRHKTAYQALRELVFEPTCNIAGLASGHVGKGAKTITPSLASVKIDFRLVPGQRPEEVLESLRRFVKRFGDFDINVYTMLPPARCRPGSPVVKAAVEAAVEIYGVKPNVFPSMYGTGPLASIVKHGIDAGMLNSISNPESNLHAPNENIMKKDLMRSTLQLASMFRRLAT